MEFLEDFNDCKQKVIEKMYSYNDALFQTLEKIVKNVPWFRTLSLESVRRIIFKMRKRKLIKHQTVMKFNEYYDKTIFIFSGVLWVYVIDVSTNQRVPFQYLKHGAWLNLLSNFSLFEIQADSNWVILEVTKQDFKILKDEDYDIHYRLEKLSSKYHVWGIKYDFVDFMFQQFKTQKDIQTNRNQRAGFVISNPTNHDPFETVYSERSVTRASVISVFDAMSDNVKRFPMRRIKPINKKVLQTLRKIKSMARLLIDRIYWSYPVFLAIDKYYNERIELNTIIHNNDFTRKT